MFHGLIQGETPFLEGLDDLARELLVDGVGHGCGSGGVARRAVA